MQKILNVCLNRVKESERLVAKPDDKVCGVSAILATILSGREGLQFPFQSTHAFAYANAEFLEDLIMRDLAKIDTERTQTVSGWMKEHSRLHEAIEQYRRDQSQQTDRTQTTEAHQAR